MSAALAARLARRDWPRRALGPASEDGASPLDAAALYPRWADFLAEGDILIAETGPPSMGMGFAWLPRGASFHNPTLWGSIGWATPAAVGAAVAAPERRTVLFTGEGSHQLTCQCSGADRC